MTASGKRRMIIVGITVIIAAIVIVATFNGSQNKYCVQHIEPIEQDTTNSQVTETICFNNLADEASYITGGKLQLDPNVSEEEYRIAINEYFSQLKENR